MAQLWMQEESTREWAVLPLDQDAHAFVAGDGRPLRPRDCSDDSAGAALLLRRGLAEAAVWLVLSGSRTTVRLNGAPLLTGIRVLTDRDVLDVDRVGRFFFSSECLAQVEPFPGSAERMFCPRCKDPITAHTTAVRCPQCGVWHHQSEDLPCWSYAPKCALCDQTTDLNGRYRWTPEEV